MDQNVLQGRQLVLGLSAIEMEARAAYETALEFQFGMDANMMTHPLSDQYNEVTLSAHGFYTLVSSKLKNAWENFQLVSV